MMKDLKITKKLQVKFNQFISKISKTFSKPEQKFIKDMIFGILDSGSCTVRQIAQSLDQKITLKKIQERLIYHLSKPEFETKLIQETIHHQGAKLKKNSLIIVDPSDIVKRFAKKSEGLSRVRDGNDGKWKNGYELSDFVGANLNENEIKLVPLMSELYSNKLDLDSFKNKLMYRLEDLIINSNNRSVFVFDRGFDDRKIFNFFYENEASCIVRAKNNRDLFVDEKYQNIKSIASKTKLKFIHKYSKDLIIKTGYKKVKIPLDPHRRKKNPIFADANLVVASIKSPQKKRSGIFYFLCQNVRSRFSSDEEFLNYVLKGYRTRWKIEEVHRQVKHDLKWEDIKLQRYQRLKNMNLLLWLSICFVYSMESLKLIFLKELPNIMTEKKRFKELKKFIYYRIFKAVSSCFKYFSINRSKTKFTNPEFEQMEIPI